MIHPVELFLLFVKAAFLSFGGMGSLPMLHQDLANRGVSEAVFGQALAVGRVSPGPNGLYMVSLGYQLAGFAGGMEAALACLLPPLTILGIAAYYKRVAHLRRTQTALAALGFAVAGLIGATAWQILAGSAKSWLEWLAAGVAVVLLLKWQWHPLALIFGAAVLGIVVYR